MSTRGAAMEEGVNPCFSWAARMNRSISLRHQAASVTAGIIAFSSGRKAQCLATPLAGGSAWTGSDIRQRPKANSQRGMANPRMASLETTRRHRGSVADFACVATLPTGFLFADRHGRLVGGVSSCFTRAADRREMNMASEAAQDQSFRIERHGEIAIVTPSAKVEEMHETLIEQAARMVVQALREDPPEGIVVDLSQVNYFGSVFVSFLLRCHALAKKSGSEIVLAGASEPARERLHLLDLETLCALYDTRKEAIEALSSSD